MGTAPEPVIRVSSRRELHQQKLRQVSLWKASRKNHLAVSSAHQRGIGHALECDRRRALTATVSPGSVAPPRPPGAKSKEYQSNRPSEYLSANIRSCLFLGTEQAN